MEGITKLGIVGRSTDQLCDGQTIKTRVLVEELKRKYPCAEIFLVDTYQYQKHPWSILKNLFICMKESQAVFVLLSRNGMRVIFPIINFLNRFYRKPILHDCIGGSLDVLAEKYPGIRLQLNRFDVNWVESPNLKMRLEKMGIRNVVYLPNFKRLNVLPEGQLRKNDQRPFRFCTFSRVNEAKGVGRAAEAIIQINRKAGRIEASLDVYGPIEEDYGHVLKRYAELSDGAVAYRGVASPDQSVEILKDYYALLFPTTFDGEGFPGTVIDALSAGLPIIATQWHCNGEIIAHGKTGFLYPVEQPEQLGELIERAMLDAQSIFEMRKNCVKEAMKYDADTVMGVICDKLDKVVSSQMKGNMN